MLFSVDVTAALFGFFGHFFTSWQLPDGRQKFETFDCESIVLTFVNVLLSGSYNVLTKANKMKIIVKARPSRVIGTTSPKPTEDAVTTAK